MINGKDLVRYFSEIEDERYYSDYEIEDLYERAFSEGYEYAQKEFSAKGVMNKIKALPRQLKRNVQYDVDGVKMLKAFKTGDVEAIRNNPQWRDQAEAIRRTVGMGKSKLMKKVSNNFEDIRDSLDILAK